MGAANQHWLYQIQHDWVEQFGGNDDFIGFPGHIVRNQGGFPVLDNNVSSVKLNPEVDITVPPEASKIPAIKVAETELAKGVWVLTGGTHHSVAIEQKDHLVVVEAP
jgi:hypothetical protein